METALRILLLEDIPQEANLIERAMRKENINCVIKRVDTREEFMHALDEFHPDLVLSDHALPQFNSIEALKVCRKYRETIPFILVTGTVSEEFAVTCLKQGADDYVLKSNLSRLPSSIRNALHHRQTEELKSLAEAEIKNQNEQLSKANAALVKTNNELDKFVYSVSHNLRGPVSSIQGLLNLIRIESPDKSRLSPDYVAMIETNVGRLETTIREIIQYAQNSRLEVANHVVDIKALFDQVCSALSYLPGYNSINFQTDLQDKTIHTDESRLSIILTNLLSNCIRYQDPSRKDKFIQLSERRREGNIILTLTDNGIGIPKGVLPRVFDMFYRGTPKSDGAGLGLYVVKETVEKLRGTISIESVPDEGTVVAITLPETNQISNPAA